MKENIIKDIIDSHLKNWVDIDLNKLPGKIESEMADPNQDLKEEWHTWLPINSRVTDREIEDFEKQIGHKLPADYKIFLKAKHFYELNISEASFCRHPVNVWRAQLNNYIFNTYPTEPLIEKGYMPFADWSDWGLLCFDVNRNNGDNNYPIVLWDHEVEDEVQDVYKDFFDLITQLDKEEKQNPHV